MEKFRTEVKIAPADHKISHRSGIMMIGSCFTENIGARLSEYKFNVDLNPFGIVYNPMSVNQNLEAILSGKKYMASDLYNYQDTWISFDHHSRFSFPEPEVCLREINSRIENSHTRLRTINYLIITFGTAWIYRIADSGRLVSNCHKIPASFFSRQLLKVDDIIPVYEKLIGDLIKINQGLRIIFTVSPIRHWKDGPVQNTVSKSTLILSIHEILKLFDCTEYFPAYEIALDDLRDYRYYEEDMIHPNSQMTGYIWEKFCQSYFGDETLSTMKDIAKLNSALKHRPFQSGSKKNIEFLNSQLEFIQTLKQKYPFLDFSADETSLKNQLPL
jgi:GSCFA family